MLATVIVTFQVRMAAYNSDRDMAAGHPARGGRRRRHSWARLNAVRTICAVAAFITSPRCRDRRLTEYGAEATAAPVSSTRVNPPTSSR